MLNQKIFLGVGNYIRADALYLSKINPFIEIKKLKDEELIILIKNIKKVMKESYKSQLKCYLGTKYYKYENLTPCYKFKVYHRLYTDKKEKVLKKKINGRTIWYVKN